MINQTIPQWFREECSKLQPMTWRQRLDYFWTYYKIHTFLLIGCIALLISYCAAQNHANKEVLISGVFINTDTSAAGYDHLSEDYWQYCGANADQRVDIIETLIIDFSHGDVSSDTSDKIMQMDALIATASLDYMILDETALEFYAPQELCMDLTQVLSADQLEQYGENLVSVFGLEHQEDYVAALDISESSFAQMYGLSQKPSYLVFLFNTPHPEKIQMFLAYLLGS